MDIFFRQQGIPLKIPTHVVILGAGAVGSAVALLLAKAGVPQITVIDHDIVERHNTSIQWYSPKQVNKPKVYALQSFIKFQAPWCTVIPVQQKVTPQNAESLIPQAPVIVAPDNMEARKTVYSIVRRHSEPAIDIRVLWPHIVIYNMRSSLFPESLNLNAVEGRCTAQNTIFLSMLAASVAVNLLLTQQSFNMVSIRVNPLSFSIA